MIPRAAIIAASLNLEPNRAAVLRDVYRANARGLHNIVVNENMVSLAMEEVRSASLDLQVTGIVGFPIGQWLWPAKACALKELDAIQNGPQAVMHGVGPWLDGTEGSKAEHTGIAALSGDVWVMTSLSAIPTDRFEELANDMAQCGATMLILSNGVAASGVPLPDKTTISAIARCVEGRFKLAAMAPYGTPQAAVSGWLNAGVDRVICTDFWELTAPAPDNGRESK